MARYLAEDFLKAIPDSGGIVSIIARRVGCRWETAWRRINSSPRLRRAYDDECERVLDLCESVLLRSIEAGNTQDAKWYLARKGRRRGYGDYDYIDADGA